MSGVVQTRLVLPGLSTGGVRKPAASAAPSLSALKMPQPRAAAPEAGTGECVMTVFFSLFFLFFFSYELLTARFYVAGGVAWPGLMATQWTPTAWSLWCTA